LYERNITTRALAKVLGIAESHLSYLFSGKVPAYKNTKSDLSAIRRQFRMVCAARAVKKEVSITEAASIARISYRSMARAVQSLKTEAKPNET
jgi:predicted transcriptional regulator